MNWDAIGAIGQTLGSVAVFVTLGYLTVQMRHARGEMRRSITQDRGDRLRQFNMTYATDERLGNLDRKVHILLGGQDFPFVQELVERIGVTAEDAQSVYWTQMAWWNYRANMIPYLSELPPGEQKNFELLVKSVYGSGPATKLWYEKTKPYLNPDTVRYVDNLLAQPG